MRVLSLLGDKLSQSVAAKVPEAEIVVLPADRPLPAGARGDVLWSMASARALENLQADVPWVHIHGTGVDAVPAEVFRGRTVTCSRGATAGPIAEFALATMLAFEKGLPEVWLDGPPDNWGVARLGSLADRRLAVLGMGATGTAVARLAQAFGMQVVAARRTATPSTLDQVVMAPNVQDAVRAADNVVVAVPATAHTRHLLAAPLFDAMPPGVHLVNIARGSVVDQGALRDALDSGRVAKATLDVCDPEPLPAGHWMYNHPSVRLSPHVSWSSPAMGRRILEQFVTNLHARAAGSPLRGTTDPETGY